MAYPRIPRQVRFPFGWRIKIREVPRRVMNRHIAGAAGIWIHEGQGGIAAEVAEAAE